jgi:excisionase family DNA binding protein
MVFITQHDGNNLWNTVGVLTQESKFSEAKTILKLISEQTFESMKIPVEVFSSVAKILPTPRPFNLDSMEKFKQLDYQLRELQKKQQVLEVEEQEIKHRLIEYVDALSEVLGEEKTDQLRKELLANLISITTDQLISPVQPVMLDQTEIYSTSEASEILGVSDQTIRRMCEAGRFPGAYRIGDRGNWKIPKKHFKITLEEARRGKQQMHPVDEKTRHVMGDSTDEFDIDINYE